VTFRWTGVTDAAGYRIEAGSAPGLANLAAIDVSATPVYSVPNVPTGTYYVRVRAVGPSGLSEPSNEVVVQVGGQVGPGCPGPPETPQALQVRLDITNVTVFWQAAPTGCPATSFILRAGSAPTTVDVAQVPVQGTSFSANAPDGVYYVSVVAANAFGVSAPAAPVEVRVIAPSATGQIVFNQATVRFRPDEHGNVAFVGEVVNRSLNPVSFVYIAAEVRGAGDAVLGTGATFLRGHPRRLAGSGVMDDSALGAADTGCFYLQTSIPFSSVANARLVVSHDRLPTIAPVNRVEVTSIQDLNATQFLFTAHNFGPAGTLFNLANVFVRRGDGRAVSCDFAFVNTPDSRLNPGQAATSAATIRSSGEPGVKQAWMQWQEVGDPLAALTIQTFQSMRASIASGSQREAQSAWESLQEQRRAYARQAGR
jgi:hypothetical protein